MRVFLALTLIVAAASILVVGLATAQTQTCTQGTPTSYCSDGTTRTPLGPSYGGNRTYIVVTPTFEPAAPRPVDSLQFPQPCIPGSAVSGLCR